MILNRLNSENTQEHILAGMEFREQYPFLLYKRKSGTLGFLYTCIKYVHGVYTTSDYLRCELLHQNCPYSSIHGWLFVLDEFCQGAALATFSGSPNRRAWFQPYVPLQLDPDSG